jgi:glutamate synthase (NADPH) large chain
VKETGSRKGEEILRRWDRERANFIQCCPKEMLPHLRHPITVEATALPAE